MNILHFGSYLLKRSYPLGILLGGTALVLTIPPVRRGLRTLAIAAARGVLSITDETTRITSASRESMKDIISDAKNPDTCPSCSKISNRMRDLKIRPRRLAVAATMGVLSVSDKAKSLYKDASRQVQTIVDEAKNTKASSNLPGIEIQKFSGKHHSSTFDEVEVAKH